MKRAGSLAVKLSGKAWSAVFSMVIGCAVVIGGAIWSPAQQVTRINDLRGSEQERPALLQSPGNHNVGNRGVGLIPNDRYRAHFGEAHKFHLSPAVYGQDRHFQYGGYSFGFVDEWPTNWLSKESVFIVQIEGGYYLCNSRYVGVTVPVSITASSADREASIPSARPRTSKTSRATVGPALTAKTG